MPHSISSMPIIIFVRSHYKISPKRTVYKVHTHYYKKKNRKNKTRFCGTYYSQFVYPTGQTRRTYSAHNNIEVITGMVTSAI